MFRRGRIALFGALAVVLTWTSVAFLASSVTTTSAVTILPGADPVTGDIATVTPLTATITRPSGKAQQQAGLKFAQVDVAAVHQDNIRLSVAWTNETTFRRQTQIGKWALLVAAHYPVREAACDGSDPGHAVTLVEDGTTYCTYRDAGATGPSVVPNGSMQGGQFLASDRLVGTLLPALAVPTTACTASGTTACNASGDAAKVRFFVVGTLMNPSGNAPPGQQTIDGVQLFLRVSKLQ